MTTVSDMRKLVELTSIYNNNAHPIYQIVLFQNTGEDEKIYLSGTHSGLPDTGLQDYPGFYYELSTAIQAMNENWCDIQETVFKAGFILVHFPGLYSAAGPEFRMYFRWDEKLKGFFQAEEPPLFQHLSY